jgi:hypothetical protein
MKKRFFILTIVTMFALTFVIGCMKNKFKEEKANQELITPPYRIISVLPDELYRVTVARAISDNDNDLTTSHFESYYSCIDKGLKELRKKYIIKSITPLAARVGYYGSATTAIYVLVEPEK